MLLDRLGRLAGDIASDRHGRPDEWLAKAHLLDSLAVMSAARGHTVALRADAAGLPLDHAGGVAFRAGVAGDALGLDDFDEVTRTHPGAVVVAALLGAVAGADRPVSGVAVLRAMVTGYEVTCRFGDVAGAGSLHDAGFHPTAVCGALGGAAAVAVLVGVDPTAAVGLAASLASGIFELDDGGAVKGVQVGWSAHASLTAARLAAAGYVPAAGALEGPKGLLRTLGRAAPDDGLVGEVLDGPPRLERVSFKPYSHFTDLHPATAALVGVLARDRVDPADVAEIEVHLRAGASSRLSTEFPPPSTRLARRCPRFALSVVAYRADRDLAADPLVEAFGTEALADPEILALAERVHWLDDLPPGAGSPAATVTVRRHDGGTATMKATGYPGDGRSPEHRWGWPEIVERCSVLVPHGSETLVDSVATIESITDVRPLVNQPGCARVRRGRSAPGTPRATGRI